ncbi:MAG TPA: LapA family protein [Rectinemataceae bacterium]|nr:LapA family protein [Rectinemataceae bacterium]
MKAAYIVLILLVALAAIIFASQNSAPITITLFAWSISGSLSLVLIVTLVIGFALGMLVIAPSLFRRSKLSSGLKKKVAVLEKEKAGISQNTAEDGDKAPAGPPKA